VKGYKEKAERENEREKNAGATIIQMKEQTNHENDEWQR